MNSAAKLRKRSVATLAASALLIGGVAPAAFAYRAPDANTTLAGVQAPTSSAQAGAASFGLTDTDPKTDGTQGATAVNPGGTGQAVGQMKFVLPSTWQAGDSIDFVVGGVAATANDRVSYSSAPTVQIAGTAYDERTHIADTSPSATGPAPALPGAVPAPPAVPLSQGSTEDGKLTAYTAGAGETTSKAPAFSQALLSVGANNYQNVLRITFSNDSDPAAARAKYVGTIDAKFDVGSNVTGAIAVTANGVDNTGAGDSGPLEFWGDTDQPRNVTYPAAVLPASLEVQNGSVVADGSNQNVGPLTATANGRNFTDNTPVTVQLAGATFTADPVIVNAYNAAGTLVESTTINPVAGTNVLTYTVPTSATNDVARVVFTNPVVKAPTSGAKLTYTLAQTGGLGIVGPTLGNPTSPTHQVDIVAPASVTATQPVASDLPDRLGGRDRYQTAVAIAERALGTSEDGVRGESDNVVIASGEGFADALSAGYLAATKDAQLILTRQGSLPQTDVEFLKTYGAKNIFIVGGTGSVSKAVEDQLKAMQSFDVQAADGATRPTVVQGATTYNVTTSNPTGDVTAATGNTGLSTRYSVKDGANTVSVTRTAGGTDGNIATTADNDAITAANVNGSAAGVTITTPGVAGAAGTITWTTGGKAFTIGIAPGTAGTQTGTFDAAVTEVPGQLGDGTEPIPAGEVTGANRKIVPLDSKLTVTRIKGADRYATNREVNSYAGATSINPVGSLVPEYGKAKAKTALITSGEAPWDALASGPLVGDTEGFAGGSPLPLILTRGSNLEANAKAQLQGLDIENAIFIGGKGVLPDASMTDADNLGAYTSRISGTDRWTTAKAIGEFALRSSVGSSTNKFPGLGFTANNPILANGGSMNGSTGTVVAMNGWADALASGPWAADSSRIIALTDSTSLPGATKDLLSENASKLQAPVVAVGLGGAVSTETVKQANSALTVAK